MLRVDTNIQSVLKYYAGSPEFSEAFSGFMPIDQLHRDDADVMLFFLSAPNIIFTNITDDPWYSAHQPGPSKYSSAGDGSVPTYTTDEPASILGCTMQAQYCNPNLPEDSRCSPLTGYVDDRIDLFKLYDTLSQKTMFKWAIDVFQLGFFSISGIVDNIGTSALLARQGLNTNQQGPLPSNQWQLEVESWVSTSLASVQATYVEFGNGPTSAYQQFRMAPNGTDQDTVCKSIVSIPSCAKHSSPALIHGLENCDYKILVLLRPGYIPYPRHWRPHHDPRPRARGHCRLHTSSPQPTGTKAHEIGCSWNVRASGMGGKLRLASPTFSTRTYPGWHVEEWLMVAPYHRERREVGCD